MVFLEELPEQCPPAVAVDAEFEGIYRVVTSANPTIDDFLSHAQLGKVKPPTVDECRWRSCSLFIDRDRAVNTAAKLPKPRFKDPHLAAVNISPGDGRSHVKKGHVDLWIAKTFDTVTAVVEVEKLS